MAKPLVRPEFYTYADYYSWPDAIRGELIDGQFYDMNPAPAPLHQRIAGNLYMQIGPFFRGKKCRAFIAPFDVRLPGRGQEDGMERDVVQPDIVVIRDAGKIDDRGCRGAPDWVIEVLSPSTREKDVTLKRDLYERHRVKLYWIVSPHERSCIALSLDGHGRFVSASVETQGMQSVPGYPGLEIDWDWVFEGS